MASIIIIAMFSTRKIEKQLQQYVDTKKIEQYVERGISLIDPCVNEDDGMFRDEDLFDTSSLVTSPSALTYPSALPFDERTASLNDDGSYRSVDTFDNLFGYNAKQMIQKTQRSKIGRAHV